MTRKLVIAGGTGLLGRALAKRATAEDWDVTVLTRSKTQIETGACVMWDGEQLDEWMSCLEGADAVVNLCGASIGEGRWTTKRKTEIHASRIKPTHCLLSALEKVSCRPKFLQASAVGYYGPGDSVKDESDRPGNDYLSRLAIDWEEAASTYDGPTTITRLGVVLDSDGGALPRLAMPFRVFLGGSLGSGDQWFSWISLLDATRALMFVLNKEITGPVNMVAPTPLANKDVALALGKVLSRPSITPTPEFVLRTMLGEQATLLLEGQRILPTRLTEAGFEFEHPAIEQALQFALA